MVGQDRDGHHLVTLRGVPSRLLLRHLDYLDDVLRELQLARLGEEGDADARVAPPGVLAQLGTLLNNYRDEIRHLRAAGERALRQGRSSVDITLPLPEDARHGAVTILELLERIDQECRDGRLLTSPAEPALVAFRTALSQEVADQLSGESATDDPYASARALAVEDRTHVHRQPAGDLETKAPDGEEPTLRQARLELPRSARAARLARSWVATTCAEWQYDAAGEQAAWPVSELVSNALLHTEGRITLVLALTPVRLRVEIHDESSRLPDRSRHDATGLGGRGLQVIEGFSDDWGAYPVPTGKAVWFETAVSV